MRAMERGVVVFYDTLSGKGVIAARDENGFDIDDRVTFSIETMQHIGIVAGEPDFIGRKLSSEPAYDNGVVFVRSPGTKRVIAWAHLDQYQQCLDDCQASFRVRCVEVDLFNETTKTAVVWQGDLNGLCRLYPVRRLSADLEHDPFAWRVGNGLVDVTYVIERWVEEDLDDFGDRIDAHWQACDRDPRPVLDNAKSA